MKLSQLRVFCEVMKSGSVSKTATTLGRTQPAVSLAIKNLEESIGLKLFERQGRHLVAVPEAFYLQGEANEILNKLASVSRTMYSMKNSQAGNLNVAAMPGPASYLFPRYISHAIGSNDKISISLSAHSSIQIHELAATQSIDFGFADIASKHHVSTQYNQEVISADCFCALPHQHALTNHREISIHDLDQIPLGGLQNNHQFTQRVMQAFEQHSVQFNKTVDSQTSPPLLQFVSAGQCLAIIDPLTMITEMQNNSTKDTIVFRPMAEPLRYEYAVLSSRLRPLSQLAIKIKQGWIDEVVFLLEEFTAYPKVTNADQNP